jgi:hypothetical protein
MNLKNGVSFRGISADRIREASAVTPLLATLEYGCGRDLPSSHDSGGKIVGMVI